jgi:hypothetical protein
MAQNDNKHQVIQTVELKVSSGDISGLLDAVPDLELLGQEDTLGYLSAVKVAAPALRSSTNKDAKKVALSIFEKVIEKKAPAETDAATEYFRLKDKIIRGYFNLEEVRANKARLLMAADFLGEIRSKRIPGYKNLGTNQPGRRILMEAGVMEPAKLSDPKQKAAYEMAIKQNVADMKMNRLQLALSSADTSLLFSLKVYLKEFPPKNTENRDLYKELFSRARLTKAESEELDMVNP